LNLLQSEKIGAFSPARAKLFGRGLIGRFVGIARSILRQPVS